jgi:glycosyltransferase involved in cell wall biosynthesis
MLKVTIIIPVYNVSQYIERCLDSVLNQDYPCIECIIVNDCTLDNSIELAESKLNAYSGNIIFKILHQKKNMGLSAARNRGILAADGDYVYFLDSDDTISPNCISLLSYLAEEYGADIVQGNLKRGDPALLSNELFDIALQNFPQYSSEHRWIKENILLNVPVSSCGRLVRKNFIEVNELWFREDIVNEDVLWRFFLAKYVKSIAFHQNAIYYYHYNSGSIINADNNNNKRVESSMTVLKSCLDNIDPDMRYMQCFHILKDFYWAKTINILPHNQKIHKKLFQECVQKALKSNNIPLSFKPMFLFLLLPQKTVKKLNFIWLKGLGILYRYAKYKDGR